MKRLIIIASETVLNLSEKSFTIGGLQTYIQDLIRVGEKDGFECVLCLISKREPDVKTFFLNNAEVEIIHHPKLFKSLNQSCFDYIYKKYNSESTIFIISTEQLSIRSKAHNVIAIQHGIAFDDELRSISNLAKRFSLTKRIYAHIRAEINYRRGTSVSNIVCVDFNYFNWIRTLGDISSRTTYKIILNHSNIVQDFDIDNISIRGQNRKKIIFARRFVSYRGAIIFANVIDRLLNENAPILVTFAGKGPLEDTLKQRFKNNDKVDFISFSPDESVEKHLKYDIAVIPTIFSEGSSLSLSESMMAGCLPIVTHVGGMTNMVIDGFNGILAYPSEEGLYAAINKALHLSDDQQLKIRNSAYHIAKESFNLEKWEREWSALFVEILFNNRLKKKSE